MKDFNFSEEQLQELNDRDAIQVIPERVPVHMMGELDGAGMEDLLRKLIIVNARGEPKDAPIKQLTEAQFRGALRDMERQKDDYVPEHYVRGPERFGNKSLTTEDKRALREHRKATNGALPIEAEIRQILELHRRSKYSYSEDQLIEALGCSLSSDCQKTYSTLTIDNDLSLDRLIIGLQHEHGSMLSLPTAIDYTNEATHNAKNAMDLIERFDEILDRVPQAKKELGQIMMAQIKQFLHAQCHYDLAAMVWGRVNELPPNDFKAFKRMCKDTYEVSLQRCTRHKAHNVTENPQEEWVKALTKNVTALTEKVHQLSAGVAKNNAQNGIKCFVCQGNHMARECPDRRARPKSQYNGRPRYNNNNNTGRINNSYNNSNSNNNGGVPYCRAKCTVHKGSYHTNMDCKVQQQQRCSHQPGHAGHAAGDCLRIVKDNASQYSRQSNGRRQNYQPNRRQNYSRSNYNSQRGRQYQQGSRPQYNNSYNNNQNGFAQAQGVPQMNNQPMYARPNYGQPNHVQQGQHAQMIGQNIQPAQVQHHAYVPPVAPVSQGYPAQNAVNNINGEELLKKIAGLVR